MVKGERERLADPGAAPDPIYRECLGLFASMEGHLTAMRRNRAAIRRDAFRLAERVVWLSKHHRNWFVQMARGKPDELYEVWFAPFRSIGGNYTDIFKAITNGTSLNEWLAKGGERAPLRERANAAMADLTVPVADLPKARPSEAELWSTCRSQLEQIKLLNQRLREQSAVIARLDRQHRIDSQTIERIERSLADLHRRNRQTEALATR